VKLNELRDECFRIAEAHGFNEATIGEDLMLMVSELSEALEDHRDGATPTEVWYEKKVEVFDSNGEPVIVSGNRATVSLRYREPFISTGYPCVVCDGRGIAIATVANRHSSIMCQPCRGTGKRIELLKPCGIPSEIADVAIRALHFCGKHSIDIETVMREKIDFNATRPFKHGKTI
jgi:hypothetical protein